jgi:hypothetical protein
MLFGVLVLVWVGVCALHLLHAANDLRSGVAAVNRARGEATATDLANDVPAGDIDTAYTDFSAAHNDVRSVWVAPLRILPFIGRQVRSVDALSGSARTVTAAGREALSQAHALLQAPHQTPAERTTVVSRLASTVATFGQQISHLDLGPSKGLLSELASKRATFVTDLDKLQAGVHQATGATAALADLLQGPRTYLVLAANNAEMRDGSGMFLEAGTISTADGKLTLGTFTPTSELALPAPLVNVTGDLAARWGFQHPNMEWRNLALSPQFDLNASLAAQMWEAQMHQHVDGVIAVDIGALQDILTVVGPVSSGGFSVNADDVEKVLLHDQYVGIGPSDPNYSQRHEELGVLASAAFDALQQPGIALPRLATELSQAVDGRHLLMWAADPTIESDWVAAQASGRLGSDDVLLGVINQSGNKLDPYLGVTSRLTEQPQGADTAVTVAVTIRNNPPSTTASYIDGGASYPAGTYVTTVALDIPKAAGDATVSGPLVAAGSDGTSTVLAVHEELAAYQQTTVTFHFVLAGHHGRLRIDPSARIPPTQWTALGQQFTDEDAHTIIW